MKGRLVAHQGKHKDSWRAPLVTKEKLLAVACKGVVMNQMGIGDPFAPKKAIKIALSNALRRKSYHTFYPRRL